jgi:hypothetical protein
MSGVCKEYIVSVTYHCRHLTDEYPDVCNESTDLLHILAYVVVMTMMMMFMSMGSDYVSELRPPTCLLFIPHVIYERGEPWRNDADRTKLVTRAPELSGNPTTRDIC